MEVKSKSLWARISMSVPCTDEEYNQFARLANSQSEEDCDEARKLFWKLYKREHAVSDDSYMPGGTESDDCPVEMDLDL